MIVLSISLGCTIYSKQKKNIVAVWDLAGIDSTLLKNVNEICPYAHYIVDILNKSQNFDVVEREALCSIIEEYNIPTPITDEKTRLKIGKIAGAKFMVFVEIYLKPNPWLHLRLSEVETGIIQKIVERPIHQEECIQLIFNSTKELFSM